VSFARNVKRDLYGWAVGAYACGGHICAGVYPKNPTARVFYGGARGGNRGGPQVKVDLLKGIFPENRSDFNILYLLSGALYMPPEIISCLKSRGVSVVLNQNGVFYPAWYPREWQAENARMARVMDLADHVFYQSAFCKKSADRFLGTTAKACDILYNGVDTEVFIPAATRGQRQRFRFLVTGNIGQPTFYRLQNALDALVLARRGGLDIEIVFFGMLPDDLHVMLCGAIEEVNMQEFFLLKGSYSRSQAPQVFANADAYLITKHNDPCPNVVLEALSCGLPVLYAASGGVPELVGDEAGIALPVPETYEENPVPSAAAIAEGMAVIMAGRDDFASAARVRAQNMFDIRLWAERHRALFQRLIAQSV